MDRWVLLAVWVFLIGLAHVARAVEVETVRVGNPGNAGDAVDPWFTPGAVAYTYRMGKYEVTAGQYAEFLNAVARTDVYGLYSVNMDTAVNAYGCNIRRGGTPGNYVYTVGADWANRPVNFVSWGDTVRFANWMHNGQPATGVQDSTTTEDGSYLLNGAVSKSALMAVNRNMSATWVLPSGDEWYKAAYHKNNGATGNYWLYPTSSDQRPSHLLGEPVDPGNNATFRGDSLTIGAPYWRTEVGAHENSASPYGTFDQIGNVEEWDETRWSPIPGPSRGLRGGSFMNNLIYRTDIASAPPVTESAQSGFRLALVPEPGCVLLLMCGVGAWAVRPRRRVTR